VTVRRGLFNLTGDLQLARRGGGLRSHLKADSLLHAGDQLSVELDLRKRHPLVILAEASEARGGALAGGLGLAADQPFRLKISADGRQAEGRITALASSGSRTPLKADGAWTRAGARLEGHLDLSASRRTDWMVPRIGSDLRVSLVSQRQDKTFQALAFDLRSDQIHLAGKGPVDLKAR
jgi:translocation and assembly module TamB